MARERESNEQINQLHQQIVERLGPFQFKTKIPRWNPDAPISEKLEIIQRMLAVVRETANNQSGETDRELLERFQRLSPKSWVAISTDLTVDEKSKLIQKGLARLEAQKKAQADADRKVRATRIQQLEQMRKQSSQAALAAADAAVQEQERKIQLDLEKTELLAKTDEVESYLNSIDVVGLDEIIVRRKAELKREIDGYRFFIDRANLSQVDEISNLILAVSVHCNELYGIAERARERMRLDQEEARHAREVQEFKERKARLVLDDQDLTRHFGELNRLPKTSDYAISDKLKQLAKELSKHHTAAITLTFADRAKIESLEKKSVEFRERFQVVRQEIDATHQLLAELNGEAEEILNKLIQLEGRLLIIESLNEPIVALQERTKIFLRLLNQNESKNIQILKENLVPFLMNLRESSRELLQTLDKQDAAIIERGRKYLEGNPKFYMTKGGWVVEKLGDKNRVIGQIVPAAPPRTNQYIIKPITAANRKAARNIERYPLTKIVNKELSAEEVMQRQLSRENNMQALLHRQDALPPLPAPPVHGYYAFYKDSDVVGFAPSAEEVTTVEERRKLKFYPVGKHKIVGGKLQIQFDPNFDPHAWNIMTTQLPAPNIFVDERRRYGHEDYASHFPMTDAELAKVPRINYFLCKGGVVLKLMEPGDKVELVARWSMNQSNTQIQLSPIDNASKQKYMNLLNQGFNGEAIPLKQYRPHLGLINFADVESARGLTINAVTLASHVDLSGKYYIYEGGYLVFHMGEGSDEKKYILGKSELDGDMIKFFYADTPLAEDVIKDKRHAPLVVKNADYADYSKVKGGVPNAVLDLLSDKERKKEFDKRLLAESRFDIPSPRADVELAPIGSGLSDEALGPVSTDKTPGDLYLYSGGIVVEEKTISGKVAKKVVGRWHAEDDIVRMEKVSPKEGDRLSGLLELPDYPKSFNIKVRNVLAFRITNYNYEIESMLNASRSSKVGYYRFEGDGSVWFCPLDKVKKDSNGFFTSGSRKRKRQSDYEFQLVGHWKLGKNNEVKVTYNANLSSDYASEDKGYFRLLTKDRKPRVFGHQFTVNDFRPEELAEVTEQMKKYSVEKVDLADRENALASDNKAWHISLKRKEYSVFQDTYSSSSIGRHIIMTPADQYTGRSQTFWHDTKNNTIGIPPGVSIDQQMIEKYVELAGHFCKPKLDGAANPGKMAIRFNDRVRLDTRKAILDAIESAYPAMKGNIEVANDEAHFKRLMSKDSASESQSQPPSPRLSASK